MIWWTALFLWIQAFALVVNALVMRRNYKRIKGDSK